MKYFEQKYGKPSPVFDSTLRFDKHILVDFPSDKPGAPYETRVINVLLSQDSGEHWTPDEAEQKCAVFMPDDSKHLGDYKFPYPDGSFTLKKIYKSPSLAKQFPARQFRDFSKPTDPGTYGVTYHYDAIDQIRSCWLYTNLEMDGIAYVPA